MKYSKGIKASIINDLSFATGRNWYESKIHPYTAISYCNNNMSYAYEFAGDLYHVVTGIDGLGVNGKIESIFSGKFEECQEKFFELKG